MRCGRVAIIGGGGRMGLMLGDAFAPVAGEVVSLDKPLRRGSLAQTLGTAEAVILAVPITALNEVLDQIVPVLAEGAVLADICSVKLMPLGKMLEAYAGPVVGTHPLFGPRPGPEEALRVAICPGRREAGLALVEGLFRGAGFSTFRTTAEDHDRAMAYIQGLNFVTTVSYLSCLPREKEMERFLTPSFRRRMESARKMLVEDASMFAALVEENPFSADVVRRFRSYLNIAAGGELELAAERALSWWREHVDEREG
jgi:prephenate dehydrogenase